MCQCSSPWMSGLNTPLSDIISYLSNTVINRLNVWRFLSAWYQLQKYYFPSRHMMSEQRYKDVVFNVFNVHKASLGVWRMNYYWRPHHYFLLHIRDELSCLFQFYNLVRLIYSADKKRLSNFGEVCFCWIGIQYAMLNSENTSILLFLWSYLMRVTSNFWK